MVEFAIVLMYQQRIHWDDEIFEKSSKSKINAESAFRWKCNRSFKKVETSEGKKDNKNIKEEMPKMVRPSQDVKDDYEKKNSRLSKTNNIDFVAFILFNLSFFVFNYLYFRFTFIGTV